LGLLYRRVQINEDRAGDIFAVARLGKEGLKRTTLVDFLALLGIQATIRAQTVLKEIPELLTQRDDECFEANGQVWVKSGEDLQLPSTITKLSTSLADVKMADLYSG
jgi:hypothetical protein